jgi:nucleoside-diphosphate-sugar epimerase
VQRRFKIRWNLSKKTLLTFPSRLDYSSDLMNITDLIKQLAEKTLERTKSSSKIKFIPYTEAYPTGFEDMQRRVPDISKISKAVGWSPTHTLDSIIDSVAKSFG